MKIKSLVIGLMLFSLFLSACATAVSTPVAVETALPKPVEANFPTGRFIKTGTTDSGLVFNSDGTWSRFDSGLTVINGTYTVNGHTFIENDSNDSCGQAEMAFTYVFDGTNLTFNYVGDPAADRCINRTWDMNNVTYTLAEGVIEPANNKITEIKINATDYSYTAPETVNGGWVRVILTNSGTEPHHVQFLRLNDGVTVQQFEEALKDGEGPALAMTKQVGGVGAIHPGGSAQVVINLPAGEYVILCFIPSPGDHVAHLAKGMIKSLTVLESDNTVNELTASLTVNLKDFMFEMPESLPAGETVIKVVNNGPEPHEFNLLRLEDGKTIEDVMKFLNGEAGGPPPFAPVGGMNGLDIGATGYAELNLEPGMYVAICNIPSPKAEGHPHFVLGMIKEFVVK